MHSTVCAACENPPVHPPRGLFRTHLLRIFSWGREASCGEYSGTGSEIQSNSKSPIPLRGGGRTRGRGRRAREVVRAKRGLGRCPLSYFHNSRIHKTENQWLCCILRRPTPAHNCQLHSLDPHSVGLTQQKSASARRRLRGLRIHAHFHFTFNY